MIFLSTEELVVIGVRAIGGELAIRDHGLLESACARPQATLYGVDAYPTLEDKAAALVHSLVGNHALVDGNKRLGLAGLIAFLGINGRRLAWTNDEAYDFIMALASGTLDDISDIAERIRLGSEAW